MDWPLCWRQWSDDSSSELDNATYTFRRLDLESLGLWGWYPGQQQVAHDSACTECCPVCDFRFTEHLSGQVQDSSGATRTLKRTEFRRNKISAQTLFLLLFYICCEFCTKWETRLESTMYYAIKENLFCHFPFCMGNFRLSLCHGYLHRGLYNVSIFESI